MLLLVPTLLEGRLGVEPHLFDEAVVSKLHLPLHSLEFVIDLCLDVPDGTQHLL